jgi:hypothetical protein
VASVTPPHPVCHTTPASLSRNLDSPKTKVDRYENPSQLDHSSTHRQVALYEDTNSIRFAKDSSKLVALSIKFCDYS